jgi:hypothetical protein
MAVEGSFTCKNINCCFIHCPYLYKFTLNYYLFSLPVHLPLLLRFRFPGIKDETGITIALTLMVIRNCISISTGRGAGSPAHTGYLCCFSPIKPLPGKNIEHKDRGEVHFKFSLLAPPEWC